YQGQADDGAKRQRGEHAALRGENDLCEHVVDAERDRRGYCGRKGKEKRGSQADRALVGLLPASAAAAAAATADEGALRPRLIGRRQRGRLRRSAEQLLEPEARGGERSQQ